MIILSQNPVILPAFQIVQTGTAILARRILVLASASTSLVVPMYSTPSHVVGAGALGTMGTLKGGTTQKERPLGKNPSPLGMLCEARNILKSLGHLAVSIVYVK